MYQVVERTGEVAGVPTRWLAAGSSPVLYVHGVPTAAWDWHAHLARTGGVAPDLPGFGRSAKPAGFDHSIDGYQRWLEHFLDAAGLDRFSLVVHDWGAVGLAVAQRFPDRLDRLVVHSCVPFLPGYRWHVLARAWRTPVLGELVMAAATRATLRLLTRVSNVTPGPMPDWFLDQVWAGFDRSTRRAILRLYRSAPGERLARAGAQLHRVRCPTLILWPTRDPYLGPEWGPRYARAFGGDVQLDMVDGTGHWMWLDRPELIDRVARFLAVP